MVHKAMGREEARQVVYSVEMSIAMSTRIRMGGMSKKKGIGQRSLIEYLLERQRQARGGNRRRRDEVRAGWARIIYGL